MTDAQGGAATGPGENGRRPVPRTARERARAEITAEILDAARGYLATDGAPALSLDTPVRFPAGRVTLIETGLVENGERAPEAPVGDLVLAAGDQ